MWINRRTGQRATGHVMLGIGTRPVTMLKFATSFANDAQIQTVDKSGFDVNPWPGLDFLHAPNATDPQTLYRLHCWRESKHPSSAQPRTLYPVGEEIRYVAPSPADDARGMVRQVSSGRFRRTASGANAPTLKGAFGIIWPQLPPMRFFYAHAERRRARRQLAAALAEPATPAADVTVIDEPSDTLHQ